MLPENGLDSDHDQVYLRFLFRLGNSRKEGEALFETFEKLLDELGIQIEFNTDDDAIQEVTRNLADIGYDDEQAQLSAEPPSRARHATVQQMYDGEGENAGLARSRADSRASTSRLEVSKKAAAVERPASRATTRPTERTSNVATSNSIPVAIPRGRLTAKEWTQDLREQMNVRDFVRASSHGERGEHSGMLPIRPPQNKEVALKDKSFLSSGDHIGELSQARYQGALSASPFVLDDEEKIYAPSRTQLLRDAYIFHSYRIRSVARDAVEKWCHAALEAKDHHEHMYRIASAHDKEVLLRQAFEHWRLRLHEKKQAVETRRYFDRLERRVAKARDLYLLTNAFTHWLQCAQDEVLRTSLARQHVLSIKYFHAWKDLTIANQKKAYVQCLQKYLIVWRRRYFQAVTNEIKADLAAQRRLMRNAYWHWFWSFCEARAPVWQARRLKQRSLLKWVNAFQTNRQRDQQVTLHIELASRRFSVSVWLAKARKALHNEEVAASYRRQKLTSRALGAWVRTRRYSPLVQQVSNMADWRVAGVTFGLFINRYRLEKQAKQLKRLRVMRNAWTQWNDHLRWQTLARRVDDRRLLEALYKWTIAERLSLLRRLSEQRLKGRCLLKLRDQWSLREAKRNDASRVIETQTTRRSLHLILLQWRLRSRTFLQNQKVAIEFHAPKVSYEALQSLTRVLEEVRILNRMARDAAFYFTAKCSLKRWHIAAVESKRQKRRSAYIVVKRKTKMNLASAILQRWRSATAVAQDIADEATLFDHNRLLRLAATLFSQWRSAYENTVDLQFQATSRCEEQSLLRHLRIWRQRTAYFTDLDRKALLYAFSQQQNLAFNCLNKLRLRLIELKGPQATAENLRVRYQKRHFHRTLRYWQDKVANRLDKPTRSRAAFSTKARRTRLLPQDDDQLVATARAEEWTELDHGEWSPRLDNQSRTTFLSGYLDTPSKRAAHARALILDSTTPKGTPTQMRLRAQLNATPGTTKRELFGRSAMSLRKNSFGGLTLPVEGSGSTTVVDRDE